MILVAGATGSLGGKITQQLLEGGFTVRALVRRTSDYAALQAGGVEIVVGDVKDPGSLVRACDGVDMVISTVTSSKRGDDTADNVDRKGNLNLIEAARVAGVAHFVFVSTVGAAPDSPVDVFRAKAACEEALRASGIAYTILQSTAFMDVWFGMLIEAALWQGEPIKLIGESKHRHSFIAEQDVAAFAIGALRHSAARNVTLVIGGPEAITLHDAIHAYEAVLHRDLLVRSVPPGSAIPGLPPAVSVVAAGFDSVDVVVPMAETAAIFGVPMTSARAFAAARAAAIPQVAP